MKVYIVKFIDGTYAGLDWDKVIQTYDPYRVRFFPEIPVLEFTMRKFDKSTYTVHEITLP